jgi:hypothetical protein
MQCHMPQPAKHSKIEQIRFQEFHIIRGLEKPFNSVDVQIYVRAVRVHFVGRMQILPVGINVWTAWRSGRVRAD